MTVLTGGCQCGAVRYRIESGVSHNHFCHCRMCQKATGGVFAALAGAPKSKVVFEGPLSIFESSTVADRGFCAACGTPLTFAYKDSDWMNVTIGSLDDPEAAPLEMHWGAEGRIGWLELGDDKPMHVTGEGLEAHQLERLDRMVSHQRAGG